MVPDATACAPVLRLEILASLRAGGCGGCFFSTKPGIGILSPRRSAIDVVLDLRVSVDRGKVQRAA